MKLKIRLFNAFLAPLANLVQILVLTICNQPISQLFQLLNLLILLFLLEILIQIKAVFIEIRLREIFPSNAKTAARIQHIFRLLSHQSRLLLDPLLIQICFNIEAQICGFIPKRYQLTNSKNLLSPNHNTQSKNSAQPAPFPRKNQSISALNQQTQYL